ncbi:MAG: hypothetical protein KGL01_03675 [Betaproteobacteria bacterium]|nr:hypothetical protein [Betaproteobacteria bacterium]
MKTIVAAILLALLAACKSAPKLEEDARYVRLATVVDIHEFTETERKQAEANMPRDSGLGSGISLGVGGGGGVSFGGVMVGIGSALGGQRDDSPQIAKGANRYTVQPLGSTERIEVMSYESHKPGDCVKVLAGHPKELPRFFELKPGERCE